MTATVWLAHPRGILVVSGACFVALALAVVLVKSLPADASLRDGLLALGTPGVVAFMRVVSELGTWRFLAPATIATVLLVRRARADWWLWILLMIVAPLAEGGLKELVGRPRPEDSSMGFPSGHATAVAAYFGALMYFAGSLPPPGRALARVLALVLIVLVALARVILRAHWPSDVLGGTALGLAFAAAAALIASRRAAAAQGRL